LIHVWKSTDKERGFVEMEAGRPRLEMDNRLYPEPKFELGELEVSEQMGELSKNSTTLHSQVLIWRYQ
jgi:hypothetical protein